MRAPETAVFSWEGGPPFVGKHMPDIHWNGWAVPAFNEATAKAIAAFMNEHAGEDDDRIDYDHARNVFVVVDRDGDRWPCSTIELDGERMHRIGDGWTWDVEDTETLLAGLKSRYPAHGFELTERAVVTDDADGPSEVITFIYYEICTVDPMSGPSGMGPVDPLQFYGISATDAAAIRAHNGIGLS